MALTKVSGDIIQDNVVVAGILTVTNLKSQQISVTGISTVGSLSIGNTSVISTGRQLQNIVSLDATTTATIESAITNAPNTFSDLSITGISTLGSATASSLVVSGVSTLGIATASSLVVSGISTLGITSTTNLTSQQLSVSGISTFTNGPVLVGSGTSTGTASQRLQVTGGAYVSGSVGIGTTSPGQQLSIYGAGGDVFQLWSGTTSSGSADTGNAITFVGHDGSINSRLFGRIGVYKENSTVGDVSSYMSFSTRLHPDGTVEKVRINSAGNLGIGITNPSSKLQINYSSSTAYSSTASPQTVNSIALFNTDTTATTTFSSIALGNRRNGNTGIVGIECVGTGNDATALTFKTQSAGPVFSEVMRLSSTGRVAIGTDSNIDKLLVVDSMAKVANSSGWGIVVSDSNTDGVAGRGGAIAFGARRTDGGSFNCGAISGAKSNSTGANENGDLVLWSSVSSSLTERMRIDSAGMVTTPYQPSWNLRPNGSGNVTTTTGADIVGWTNNTSGSSAKLCHIQGVTLTGSSGGILGAATSGRINFPVAGRYKVWCTIRLENNPGQGNIYFFINGVSLSRQHVELWRSTGTVIPYTHGFQSQIINVAANDYLEIQIAVPAGAIISGYNDNVNWCGGYLIG